MVSPKNMWGKKVDFNINMCFMKKGDIKDGLAFCIKLVLVHQTFYFE